MGYDINRIVDCNVDSEFLCDICHEVLEEPLMIVNCEHIFCGECIREWLKCQSVCPNDRKTVKESQLREPFRAFRNLLNQLKISCNFAAFGCTQIVSLDQLRAHSETCRHNQFNAKLICVCGTEIVKMHVQDHQDSCLPFLKMRLRVAESHLTVNTRYFADLCQALYKDSNSDGEEKRLFLPLREALKSRDAGDWDIVEQIFVYLNWQLLISRKNKCYVYDEIAVIVRNLGSVVYNSDNADRVVQLNGLKYLLVCQTVCGGDERVNESIVNVIDSIIQYNALRLELMRDEYISMLIALLDSRKLYTSCITSLILSVIIVDGPDVWGRYLPNCDRQKVLDRLRATIGRWKINDELSRSFGTLKNVFTRLRSETIPPEVHFCYVWLLAFLTRKQCDKYFALIDGENGMDVLKSLSKNGRTKNFVRQFCDLVIYQYELYNRIGHLNGLENSEEVDLNSIRVWHQWT